MSSVFSHFSRFGRNLGAVSKVERVVLSVKPVRGETNFFNKVDCGVILAERRFPEAVDGTGT